MKDHTRRAVAYIAARIVCRQSAGSLYDYQAARHFSFGGDVNPSSISVYDYEEQCHIGGSAASLYHYGNRKHLSLEVSGKDFSGYDYDTGKHFSGSVSGNAVSVYDYEHGRHFTYSV